MRIRDGTIQKSGGACNTRQSDMQAHHRTLQKPLPITLYFIVCVLSKAVTDNPGTPALRLVRCLIKRGGFTYERYVR